MDDFAKVGMVNFINAILYVYGLLSGTALFSIIILTEKNGIRDENISITYQVIPFIFFLVSATLIFLLHSWSRKKSQMLDIEVSIGLCVDFLREKFPNCNYTVFCTRWMDGSYKVEARYGTIGDEGNHKIHSVFYDEGEYYYHFQEYTEE